MLGKFFSFFLSFRPIDWSIDLFFILTFSFLFFLFKILVYFLFTGLKQNGGPRLFWFSSGKSHESYAASFDILPFAKSGRCSVLGYSSAFWPLLVKGAFFFFFFPMLPRVSRCSLISSDVFFFCLVYLSCLGFLVEKFVLLFVFDLWTEHSPFFFALPSWLCFYNDCYDYSSVFVFSGRNRIDGKGQRNGGKYHPLTNCRYGNLWFFLFFSLPASIRWMDH